MNDSVQPIAYECFECGRRFSAPQALRIHVRMHDGKKLYECQDCGKQFKMEFYYKYHRMNDTGEEKFECGICDKKFSNESCIDTHYKVHANDKPYECKKCGKIYLQLGSFKNHVMAHPPTFSCKDCGKVYTDFPSLEAHEKVHVTQKPHMCINCGKRFAHVFNLEIHIESHCLGRKDPETQHNKALSHNDLIQSSNRWQPVNISPWRENGNGSRSTPKEIEVIDLEDDEEELNDYLPLEVCLNEGDEELSMRDMTDAPSDEDLVHSLMFEVDNHS